MIDVTCIVITDRHALTCICMSRESHHNWDDQKHGLSCDQKHDDMSGHQNQRLRQFSKMLRFQKEEFTLQTRRQLQTMPCASEQWRGRGGRGRARPIEYFQDSVLSIQQTHGLWVCNPRGRQMFTMKAYFILCISLRIANDIQDMFCLEIGAL